MYREFYEKYIDQTSIHGDELMARCPHPDHIDNKPSFSVNLKKGVFKCHGCGWTGNAFTFAKLMHIDYKTVPNYDPNYISNRSYQKSNQNKSKVVESYPYCDEEGRLLFEVERLEPKSFKFRRKNQNNNWVYNLNGTRRVLYRLQEIIESQKVIVCEGEKDVENLRKLGYTATTCSSGAGNWREEYNQHFIGKDTLLIPDNDNAGQGHMHEVAKNLKTVARTVKIVPLPKSLGAKGDVSDFIEEFGPQKLKKLLTVNFPEIYSRSLDLESDDINNYQLSELGNAEVVSHLYGDKIKYVHGMAKWLIWNGNFWQIDRDGEITRIVVECIRTRQDRAVEIEHDDSRNKAKNWAKTSESEHKIKATINLLKAQAKVKITTDKLDQDKYLLGCKNGTLDLKTGIFSPGNQDHLITKSTGINYDENSTCPKLEQFLNNIFGNNQELINYIQKAVGYSLSGDISMEVFFILLGSGANGKSTFLEVILSILGDYASITPASTIIRSFNDIGKIPNDIAALNGKRFVSCSEVNEDSVFNEARLKNMTGDDRMKGRFLHKEFFTFIPQFKLWIALNHFPQVNDHTHAFWRRVIIIPFNKTFSKNEIIPNMKKILLAEASGILNWLLEGFQKFQKEGLSIPTIIDEEIKKYKKDTDVLGQFFEECCVQGQNEQVTHRELTQIYEEWCLENGHKSESIVKLGKKVRQMDIQVIKDRHNRRTAYSGLGLK